MQVCSGLCVLFCSRNVEGSVASQDAMWGGSIEQKNGSVASQDEGHTISCASGSRAGGPPEVP